MAFANKLVKYRKNKQLTQQELAERAGIGISQMRRYEKGSSSPTLEVIRNLALTLDVSADDLIFDDNERITSGKTLDQELLRQFEMISHLSGRDIEAVKTVLESIIVKNRIERILPSRQGADWSEQMRDVQNEFRARAKKYPAQEIEDMIDEAVAAVRTEGQNSSERRSIGS